MACPTCSATMAACGHDVWHCPRCGSLLLGDALYVPALVSRCREFGRRFRTDEDTRLIDAWYVLGIDEAIRTEDERSSRSSGG